MERTLDFYRLLGVGIPPTENARGYVSVDLEGYRTGSVSAAAAPRPRTTS